MDFFSEVRNQVPAIDTAHLYGMEFSPNGKRARCVFHSPDNHPSMTFHKGRFRCWSCGANGSCIDLVMQLFNLDVLGAAKRINEDFILGLDPNAQINPEMRAERKRIIKEQEQFEDWKRQTIIHLNDICRLGYQALLYGNYTGNEDAIRYMSIAEYYSDLLSSGTTEEQTVLYEERKDIEKCIAQIVLT